MAESEMGTQLSDDIKNGTANLNAVDAIADAILKAVDIKQIKTTKDISNMRKNIINALGYKPASTDAVTEIKQSVNNLIQTVEKVAVGVPPGKYTLSQLIANGFISGSSKDVRVWIPLATQGRNVSVETNGSVTVRHSTNGYIRPLANQSEAGISKEEFDAQCTLSIKNRTAAGFRLIISAPVQWFVSSSETRATNNCMVSVSFNTALIVTVT